MNEDQMVDVHQLLLTAAQQLEHLRGEDDLTDGLVLLVRQLRVAADELHREIDPHCSCNDCIAWLDANTLHTPD